MSTPNPIAFPTLLKGFAWVPSTTGVGGVALPAGEAESGSTIGIRADGDTAHSAGNYKYFVVVAAGLSSESAADLQSKLSLPPGNYWGDVNQTDMLNGLPSTSSWSGKEAPFSIPQPIIQPASPTLFTAA